MKKVVLSIVAAMALATPALAADLKMLTKAPPPPPSPWDFAFGDAIMTDYMWRGITQSAHRGSVAAYFEPRYNFSDSLQGYIGLSGESIDFPNHAAAEIDFYGGIRPTFGKLALDFGAWLYYYPGGQCFSAVGAACYTNNSGGNWQGQALPLNGNAANVAAAGVAVSPRGIIAVDKQMRTNVPHIFAIGDVVGAPMLAHKASHEGKVAAEVAAGQKSAFDARCIPSVAFTDPEVAWVGVTETDAKAQNIQYGKGLFPWAASGRALALNRDEGFTKLLFDKETHRVIGAGVVGTNAGDLIAEVALAIEMGADAADIGLTIHAHPTLSETVAFAAEAFEGTLTDLYIPKR